MKDVAIEAGARATDQHELLVERADIRRESLMAKPERIERVGKQGDKELFADFLRGRGEVAGRRPGFDGCADMTFPG